MKHCIQINVGSRKYTFDIEVAKEADLTASFPDIISKYILKNKDNISVLEEIANSLNGEHNSSSELKNILNKEVLSDSEISKLFFGHCILLLLQIMYLHILVLQEEVIKCSYYLMS